MSLEDRVTALEARAKAGIALADLPKARLQRWLESTWQPDGAILQPGTVTPDLLSTKTASGLYTFAWPGGVSQVSEVVTHNLTALPVAVQVSSGSNGSLARLRVTAKTTTTFTVLVDSDLGVIPAATNEEIYWTVTT